jgi:hypothetical protein
MMTSHTIRPFRELLAAFPADAEGIMTEPKHDTESLSQGTWAVHRQDDNGNQFVVQQHLSHEEALRLVAEFEARGHKQLYWAEAEQGK